MLTIGSQALINCGVKLNRKSKDTDYIATYGEYSAWIDTHKRYLEKYYPISSNKFIAVDLPTHSGYRHIHEFEIAWPGSTGESLLEMCSGTAQPEVCLVLKLSHRYIKNSPHFLKTMEDIWTLRALGIGVPMYLQEWLRAREKETYTYEHPKLNQSKKDFFDASVKYVYDHDAVHRAVAVDCHPAYTFYKDDNAEVRCSRSKFFALPEQVRLNGVLEEAYVLAIERSIVPHPGVLTARQAFRLALMKVCTSITSGWFREFSWESYYKVIALYDDVYVDKFKTAVEAGDVPLNLDYI